MTTAPSRLPAPHLLCAAVLLAPAFAGCSSDPSAGSAPSADLPGTDLGAADDRGSAPANTVDSSPQGPDAGSDGPSAPAGDVLDDPGLETADPGGEDAGGADAAPGGDQPDTPPVEPPVLGGERPARVVLPEAYDPELRWPLVLLLHGFSANARVQDFYFGGTDRARSAGFILVLPDGTKNSRGLRFWDATPACCNREGPPVDDVGYLTGLVVEAKTLLSVDPARVYAMGHSNGGYMSLRLACDSAEHFTAIASLAGSERLDEEVCQPSAPVAALILHGTEDDTVPYGDASYQPGAEEVARRWASRNGCEEGAPAEGPPLDLDARVDGDETATFTYEGCPDGAAVELWKMDGSGHIPTPTAAMRNGIFEWLLGEARPEP